MLAKCSQRTRQAIARIYLSGGMTMRLWKARQPDDVPPQVFWLPRQFKIAGVNVDGKRSLDQLNRHYKFKVATRFLDSPSDALERATGDANDVACGHSRMRRKGCVLRSDAEGVHFLVVHG